MLKHRVILYFLFVSFFSQFCFASIGINTHVRTSNGPLLIQQLSTDIQLTSYDTKTNTFPIIPIIKIWQTEEKEFVKVETEEEALYVSPNHIFYVIDKHFLITSKQARMLTTGDLLVCKTKAFSICKSATIEQKTYTCYEISLEEPHLFFIGNEELLTHNFYCPNGLSPADCVVPEHHNAQSPFIIRHYLSEAPQEEIKPIEPPQKTNEDIRKELQSTYNNAKTAREKFAAAEALYNHLVPINNQILREEYKKEAEYRNIIMSRFSLATRNDKAYRDILAKIGAAQTQNDWVRQLAYNAKKELEKSEALAKKKEEEQKKADLLRQQQEKAEQERQARIAQEKAAREKKEQEAREKEKKRQEEETKLAAQKEQERLEQERKALEQKQLEQKREEQERAEKKEEDLLLNEIIQCAYSPTMQKLHAQKNILDLTQASLPELNAEAAIAIQNFTANLPAQIIRGANLPAHQHEQLIQELENNLNGPITSTNNKTIATRTGELLKEAACERIEHPVKTAATLAAVGAVGSLIPPAVILGAAAGAAGFAAGYYSKELVEGVEDFYTLATTNKPEAIAQVKEATAQVLAGSAVLAGEAVVGNVLASGVKTVANSVTKTIAQSAAKQTTIAAGVAGKAESNTLIAATATEQLQKLLQNLQKHYAQQQLNIWWNSLQKNL